MKFKELKHLEYIEVYEGNYEGNYVATFLEEIAAQLKVKSVNYKRERDCGVYVDAPCRKALLKGLAKITEDIDDTLGDIDDLYELEKTIETVLNKKDAIEFDEFEEHWKKSKE